MPNTTEPIIEGRGTRVAFVPGQHGGRLTFFSVAADSDHWDDLWRTVRPSYRRSRRGHLPHQLRATFLKWARPGGRVLEAGCGLAHFTVAARARGFQAEAVDWAPDTVARLRELLPDVPVRVGDVRKLDCPDETYDAVYSPGVCEHFVEGPEKIMAETYRVLRPGGVAVVSTPCFNRYLRRRRRLFAACPPEPAAAPRQWDDFYQYAFTTEEMSVILRRTGFEVVAVHPYGAFLTLAVWSAPWLHRLPGPLVTVLARVADLLPVIRWWGASCIWVARRTEHSSRGTEPASRTRAPRTAGTVRADGSRS